MKRLILIVGVLALSLAGLMAVATSVTTFSDGLHIGTGPTQRLIFYSPKTTPAVAQPANTLGPRSVLQLLGLQASGGHDPDSANHTQVTLTAAEIIAMYTTPKAIVPAQGAGKTIFVSKAQLRMTRTATAFTGGGVGILQYDSTANGAGLQALDSTFAATIFTGAAGTTLSARNGAVISDSTSTVTDNKGLFLSNQTGVFAAGTGTLIFDVWWFAN